MDNVNLKTQPTPTIPTPDHRKSWLSILLTALALTIIGLLLYQNISLKNQLSLLKTASPSLSQPQISPSPTLDLTAGWKTYTNQSLGITFRYPLEAQVEKRNSSENSTDAIQISYDDPKHIGGGGPRAGWFMIIDHYQNPLQLNLREFANRNGELEGGFDYAAAKYVGAPEVKETTIDGKNAIWWIDVLTGTMKYIFIEDGRRTVRLLIKVIGFDERPEFSKDKYEKVVDQILSTFRFTD